MVRLFLLVCLIGLVACSVEERSNDFDELLHEVSQLDERNTTAIDTIIGRYDAVGENGRLLYSLRNTHSETGKRAIVVLQELKNLEQLPVQPELPPFFFGVLISAQESDLDTYEIELLVPPKFDYLVLHEIRSGGRIVYSQETYLNPNQEVKDALVELLAQAMNS